MNILFIDSWGILNPFMKASDDKYTTLQLWHWQLLKAQSLKRGPEQWRTNTYTIDTTISFTTVSQCSVTTLLQLWINPRIIENPNDIQIIFFCLSTKNQFSRQFPYFQTIGLISYLEWKSGKLNWVRVSLVTVFGRGIISPWGVG